jgi:two-component system, OmpR family, KDP operon response regulator KdpE
MASVFIKKSIPTLTAQLKFVSRQSLDYNCTLLAFFRQAMKMPFAWGVALHIGHCLRVPSLLYWRITMKQHRIHTLLVSPDQAWSTLLHEQLLASDFTPLAVASTGYHALDLFYGKSPQLVLLDQDLPDLDAVDLCVELLQVQRGAKVVLMTGRNAAPPLVALHAGLSGCVPRDLPLAAWSGLLLFVLQGGIAFNHTVLEGVFQNAWTAQKRQPPLIIGLLQIDLAQRQAEYAGRRIQLTPREFALLACLARNQDRVVSFDQLLNEAWDFAADDGTPAQVRLYVTRLRRKLVDATQTTNLIVTERGVGYRLHGELLRRSSLRPDYAAPKRSLTHSTN